jgi:hypothetical protein
MDTMTWSTPCLYCHRPILRGKPTLIFSLEQPRLLGLSHSTCCATRYHYGHYQLSPPQKISSEKIAFLVNFFPKLYSLPGGLEPNSELRFLLARLLDDFPNSLIHVMAKFQKSRTEYARWYPGPEYQSDLETDYLKFLGEIAHMAKKTDAPDADFGQEPRKHSPAGRKNARTSKSS